LWIGWLFGIKEEQNGIATRPKGCYKMWKKQSKIQSLDIPNIVD